ncbi:MAG: hypothetical protein JSS12_05780 [Verrucomicrobia bacterium]|nr:hypothetical protein [Verrucomicrobiota bacterium]
MNIETQIKLTSQLKKQRVILLGLVGVFAISNLLLAASLLTADKAVLIMPTHISKEFEISSKKVSEDYLELMARDFVQSFLNMTPDTQEYLNSYVLRLAHPSYHGELKQQLNELFEEIKNKQMTLHFTLNEMDVDQDKLVVKASGYLVKHMGVREVERKLRKYHIAFLNNGTRLMLKEFYEVEDEKETTN